MRYKTVGIGKSGRIMFILFLLTGLYSLAPTGSRAEERSGAQATSDTRGGASTAGKTGLKLRNKALLAQRSATSSSADSSTKIKQNNSANPGSDAKFAYPSCSNKMHSYFRRRYYLTFFSPIYSCLFLLALLQLGLMAKLRNKFSKFNSYALQVFGTTSAFYFIAYMIKFPLIFYSGFLLEKEFSLSQQNLASWALDEAKHFLLGFLLVPLITVGFLLVRKYRIGWHLPVWALLSVMTAFLVFVEPLVVDPLFNHFTPLADSPLKRNIEALCLNAGIDSPTILVADKSKQTKKINAYVAGFSGSKRIILYDTLLKDLPDDQILAVLAHELGHYVFKHVVFGTIMAIAGLYPLMLLCEIVSNRLSRLRALPRAWGIKGNSDPAFIAVWCLAIWSTSLFISPIESYISRYMETQADSYSLEETKNPMAVARLFYTLSQVNLTDPDPPAFFEFWFYSHPSLKHRIDHALQFARQAPNIQKGGQ